MPRNKSGKPGGNTAEICRKIGGPLAAGLGLALWDVRFLREGATWYLRYILDSDKDEGVTMEDCVAFTKLINPALDAADPIPEAYCLEVQSPGVERELTRPEHFARCEGWPVRVTLFRPIDNTREWDGALLGRSDDGAVSIELEDESVRIFKSKGIAKVRVIDDFEYEL